MSAASLVINLGEESMVRGEPFYKETDSESPEKAPNPETKPDEDVDLPQCKIKRNYACSQCNYYTQNPRFYLYHLKNVHKEKIRIYECPSCLYASKHSQKLQRHVHMVHVMCGGKKKLQQKPKPAPKVAKAPKQPVVKAIKNVPKEEEHAVMEGEEFSSEMFEDDGNKNYKCSVCQFTSRSQTLVTRHERIVHLKKKFFRCIKCNYMTHMKARYTKHVKYHSMPMIKCDMCDFRTPYKWNLDRHNKNHMGDGAFKCSLCNFTADIKQSLTVHEMNHHVPPVGQATPTKRRNRVGASDTVAALEDESIDNDEMELLRLEREDEMSDEDEMENQVNDSGIESLNHLDELEVTTKPLPPFQTKKNAMKKPKSVAHFNTKELTVKIGEKVVNPGDVLQHKNGTVYVKKHKCRVCNYRAAWDSEIIRHELRMHGINDKKKVPARPIPNLIPIQNKSPTQPPPPPPLKSSKQKPIPPPQMISSHHPPPPPLKLPPRSQQMLLQTQSLLVQSSSHQMMMQSQSHPMILPPPMLQSQHFQQSQQMCTPTQQPAILKIPNPTPTKSKPSTPVNAPEKTMSEKDLNDICAKSCPNSSLKDFASLIGGDDVFKTQEENVGFSVGSGSSAFPSDNKESKTSASSSPEVKKTPDSFKKKNASFFDKLKEKLMTGAGESCNLICDVCGHESKCLSESVRHQKMHRMKVFNSSLCNGGSMISGAELSSTRCQHCRQRCKTSSDLVIHLQSCVEANKKSPPHAVEDEEEEEEEDEERMDMSEGELSENESEKPPHPMEHKVFVWNNMSNCEEDALHDEDDCGSKSPASESSIVGIETAPGIGAVTSKTKYSLNGNSNDTIQKTKSDSVKKVYKCPHCSFWASTASRFHVHIVGHLNKKPFECSLCSYRSNWRWDITKHIRLKTVRDSSHERARVLMTDETGRRNYSKYNKYLTLMRVHEPSAESSGSGRRTKGMTQSYEPIEILPALPKLTPAPSSALQSNSPNSMLMNSSTPPPLPPLSQRPGYPYDSRRSGQESEDEPPKKKQNVENKKTMWKCKKCLFRDGDRAVVLAHVKDHYRNQFQNMNKDYKGSSNELVDEAQERHCRLKHSGDVKIIVGQGRPAGSSEENSYQESNEIEDEENDPANSFMCETCPFVTFNQKDLDHHMDCHFERPGAIHKCQHCPFFVREKKDLIDHVNLHSDSDGDEGTNKFQGIGQGKGGESNSNKRYRCSICPYVSNSKSQFLYHKQFHRPRNAPFKCTMCSYNVTRRHLLHQHLRLHGVNILIPKAKDFGYNEIEEGTDLVGTMNELDTSKMTEIPLVWVSKMGNLTKMFKCRYCPHVNIRKSNIQEHEKMHGLRIKTNPDGSPPQPQQQHHCPDCNYICNNAGVLSSHAKVHQGLFGQVCSLVDSSRPDDVQIRELNTILGRHEEGPPEILPDEINKDFKDSSPAPVNGKDYDIQVIDGKVLHFCSTCPARFLYPKELEIHTRFHNLQLQFRCEHCSYTARQQPHLLAHYKVHTDEYQDRTNSLCEVYKISKQNSKPKIAIVVDGSESAGNAWVVVPMQKMIHTSNHTNEYELDESLNDISLHGSRVMHKQFSCGKCPAKFFKTVALQYHMTLHGGPGLNKCRVCDYSVKTYGNLIKHEAVHEELEPRAKIKSKPKRASENVPTSGTELFRQKTEAAQKCAANAVTTPLPTPLHIDPEFGILMHGSPEFIYPTYLKNGRLKEKRYKCHKCPSAFEKREQYKVHLSLHGSKQRYKCERCDYSVKYYANYIQHLRKHQSNDATKAERKNSNDGKGPGESGNEGITEGNDNVNVIPVDDITSTGSGRSAKRMKLSVADKQAMMLMQQKVVSNSVSAPEVFNRCPYCPYSNQRKDGVGSHVKCHSNVRGGAFTCKYCDYTVPQQHFLKEHNKLHFSPMKGMKPEAYMKCDRLELWAEPVEQTNGPVNKILIFKDKGSNFKVKRFLPEIEEEVKPDSDTKEKIYINVKSGEVEEGPETSESLEKDDDKENKDVVCNGSMEDEEDKSEEISQEENNQNLEDEKPEETITGSDAEINGDDVENEDNINSGQEHDVEMREEEDNIMDDDNDMANLPCDSDSVNNDNLIINCESENVKEEMENIVNDEQANNLSSGSDSEDSSSDSSTSTDDSESNSSSTSAHQD